jgi:hypothetical protein
MVQILWKRSILKDESTYGWFSPADIQILEVAPYAQQEVAKLLQK